MLERARDYDDAEWSAVTTRLVERGLLTPDGALTRDGRALKQDIEDRTDALALSAYAVLDDDEIERLVAALTPLAKAVVASRRHPGGHPDGPDAELIPRRAAGRYPWARCDTPLVPSLVMVRLDPKDRAGLPDRAFAYVDSRGRRRLPIHDAAHVRNALARFGQVAFEDEQSRETARLRLLNAAKRFKIVPIGFIAGQLRSERSDRGPQRRRCRRGFVTMLMTDIEGSTALVHALGAALPRS